ncbi:hypothetical protein AB8T52_30720, partial [Klebsiella quasipneumoniae subsp. similipneumoniae]
MSEEASFHHHLHFALTPGSRIFPLSHEGVASEFGKNRTVSRWHGLTSRKRSFLRGFNENQIRA